MEEESCLKGRPLDLLQNQFKYWNFRRGCKLKTFLTGYFKSVTPYTWSKLEASYKKLLPRTGFGQKKKPTESFDFFQCSPRGHQERAPWGAIARGEAVGEQQPQEWESSLDRTPALLRGNPLLNFPHNCLHHRHQPPQKKLPPPPDPAMIFCL